MEVNDTLNNESEKQLLIINNKNEAISKINDYLDKCILQDIKHAKKANLLSFWFKNYIQYLDEEDDFDSSRLKSYSRGDIIKVNLGFNVGNEEGGLHYCVVLDKQNARSHSTLTVIPLSSLKSNSKIHKTSVFLGDEIYASLLQKNSKLIDDAKQQVQNSKIELEELSELPESTEDELIIKTFKIEQAVHKIQENENRLDLITKIINELQQMKLGTIALVNQITTISKQRIYNPKKDFDILSGIKVSDKNMKLIDEKIKKLYVN